MSDLPEQVYRLGERVEFLGVNGDGWLEGIVYEAKLMGNCAWISYGCLMDNGYNLNRLEQARLRPLSAVRLLGEVLDG